jgi:hypothetical protein
MAVVVGACLVWRGLGRAKKESELGDDDIEMSTDIVLEPEDDGDESEDFGTYDNMLEASTDGDVIFGEYDGAFEFAEE